MAKKDVIVRYIYEDVKKKFYKTGYTHEEIRQGKNYSADLKKYFEACEDILEDDIDSFRKDYQNLYITVKKLFDDNKVSDKYEKLNKKVQETINSIIEEKQKIVKDELEDELEKHYEEKVKRLEEQLQKLKKDKTSYIKAKRNKMTKKIDMRMADEKSNLSSELQEKTIDIAGKGGNAIISMLKNTAKGIQEKQQKYENKGKAFKNANIINKVKKKEEYIVSKRQLCREIVCDIAVLLSEKETIENLDDKLKEADKLFETQINKIRNKVKKMDLANIEVDGKDMASLINGIAGKIDK